MKKYKFCECCNSISLIEKAEYNGYRDLLCEECGFEKFIKNEINIAPSLYENDSDYIDDLNVVESSEDLILWHHNKTIKYLDLINNHKNKDILDVGCFTGFFIKKLEALGYKKARGIDFNSDAIAFGKSKLGLGDVISTETIEDLKDSESRFDVITIFEVLEHLPNAKEFLCELLDLLNQGGLLVVSTPNNKMCWRPPLDYPPHHLSRYTIKSLDALFSEFNLDVEYFEEQMSSFDLIRHFVGVAFRKGGGDSMRGGEFKARSLSISLRRFMNKIRAVAVIILYPLDKLLHFLGVRYISQLIIVRKKN